MFVLSSNKINANLKEEIILFLILKSVIYQI